MEDGEDEVPLPRDQDDFRMPRLAQFILLREISIANLKFEICDSEVFRKGQKLRRIKWNHNRLKQVSKNCFKHLDQLIELNLDYNLLKELESALFSQLLQLKWLSIAHNRLTELAAHQFANLTSLISLNLAGNYFQMINLHLFEPMQNSLQQLNLAQNQIKLFIHTPPSQVVTGNENAISKITNTQQQQIHSGVSDQQSSNTSHQQRATLKSSQFVGVLFKSLTNLICDRNKFERIKALQLHRFFNVKFLSIKENSIRSIRDKAFNGLKLLELNLASNNLQTISTCAFCNSTIKRLILSNNNITMQQQLASMANNPNMVQQPAGTKIASLSLTLDQQPVESSESATTENPTNLIGQGSTQAGTGLLMLSNSFFGPLYNHLEYLDLSGNNFLTDQLEIILEPLLRLQFLNLASTGLDRSLPSPTMFKYQRHLRYLNLSNNQLDQLVAETVESLGELEVLDLSNNKFNELDESLLVTFDDMPNLRLINLASNPWYCSQCKIGPLYEWILRSSIYNSTCVAPALILIPSAEMDKSITNGRSVEDTRIFEEEGNGSQAENDDQADSYLLESGSLLSKQAPATSGQLPPMVAYLNRLMFEGQEQDLDDWLVSSPMIVGTDEQPDDKQGERAYEQNSEWDRLAARLLHFKELKKREESILETLSAMIGAYRLSQSQQQQMGDPLTIMRQHFGTNNFCLKCEFPSELRTFRLHELLPNDFKYCPGSAPRFSASEPKVGLTLALVIIGALFCIIIIVIIIYRRKSNTYYPNENTTGEADEEGQTKKLQRPVLSVSSDPDHQLYGGDATDYSSPPMSQSYESYSNESQREDDEDLDRGTDGELEDEQDNEYDEEEIDDYDDEEEEEEDNEEEDNESHPSRHDDGDKEGDRHQEGGDQVALEEPRIDMDADDKSNLSNDVASLGGALIEGENEDVMDNREEDLNAQVK